MTPCPAVCSEVRSAGTGAGESPEGPDADGRACNASAKGRATGLQPMLWHVSLNKLSMIFSRFSQKVSTVNDFDFLADFEGGWSNHNVHWCSEAETFGARSKEFRSWSPDADGQVDLPWPSKDFLFNC